MSEKSDEDPKPKRDDVLGVMSPLVVTAASPFVVSERKAVAVMDAVIFSRPPEDHPVYAKIGRVASDWSHVEHLIDQLLWDLTGGDERLVAASTAQMNGIYPRCMALLALLTARNLLTKELRKQISEFQGRCAGTGNLRNRIVHDAWYVVKGTPIVGAFRAMPKDDLQVGVRDIPEEHFNMVLKEINDRSNEAKELVATVRAMLQTSRGEDP